MKIADFRKELIVGYYDAGITGTAQSTSMAFKYMLNTKNGAFTPDKFRGSKAPRDLCGVEPTFEVFNRLKTRSRRLC